MMNKNTGKTALVLAGGGLTGAVYEIGALRAIDDLLVDRNVNDFDIYVGTSAGALIATFLSKGVSPEEMYQVLDGTHPRVSSMERNLIYKINWAEYTKWGVKLPSIILTAWSQYLRNLNDRTLIDLLWSFTDALPAGLYDSRGLESFVRKGLLRLDCSDEFEESRNKLIIIATELVSGKREIFGPGNQGTPISTAVAASSAFPMIYKPMKINGRDFIDGGARGNASIDLAIEHGANLVVCINPLVPFDSHYKGVSSLAPKPDQVFHDQGGQTIANQAFRIMLYAGLQYHIKQIRRSHPDVDIILIEPNPEDVQMFAYNILRYSARLSVAQYGFESVTLDLAEDYASFKETLTRHEIPISRRLVADEIAQIKNSGHNPEVVRKILEAKTLDCTACRNKRQLYRFRKKLEELELMLDHLDNPTSAPA